MDDKAQVAALAKQFGDNQSGGNNDVFEAAYDALLEIGPPVIGFLADILADSDSDSPYRVTAIDLLECFHGLIDSSAAISALRTAMGEDDPWLRLCAAEAIWIIEGDSPNEIAPDALEVIRESAESDLVQVRDRARRTMKTLKELGAFD